MSWIIRNRTRVCGFFLKADNALVGVDLHDSEFLCSVALDSQCTDGQIGLHVLVILDHRVIVHLVNVISSQNHKILGAFLFDGINVLVDRIGCPLIPILIDPLLRRYDIDKLIELSAKEVSPSKVDVAVEAHGFILRQYKHLPKATIETIRKDKIDDSVVATERNCRFCPISG